MFFCEESRHSQRKLMQTERGKKCSTACDRWKRWHFLSDKVNGEDIDRRFRKGWATAWDLAVLRGRSTYKEYACPNLASTLAFYVDSPSKTARYEAVAIFYEIICCGRCPIQRPVWYSRNSGTETLDTCDKPVVHQVCVQKVLVS